MYHPESKKPFSFEACIRILDEFKVSAHYLMNRHGKVIKLVEEEHCAWHAGKSKMPFQEDQRTGVNQFSIGIELIGDENLGFEENQYNSLTHLCQVLVQNYKINSILGHCHIAGDKKTDPWNFDWAKLRSKMKDSSPLFNKIKIGID